MKHNIKHLQTLVAVALCVIMAMAFTSCSKDDDEPDGNDLAKILVGTWTQSGDNDIITTNANGTGYWYGNVNHYENNQVDFTFNWTYSDGWVTLTEEGEMFEKMRAQSVSKDKIVWKRYDVEATEDYGDYVKDEFGYYEPWTWYRYTE